LKRQKTIGNYGLHVAWLKKLKCPKSSIEAKRSRNMKNAKFSRKMVTIALLALLTFGVASLSPIKPAKADLSWTLKWSNPDSNAYFIQSVKYLDGFVYTAGETSGSYPDPDLRGVAVINKLDPTTMTEITLWTSNLAFSTDFAVFAINFEAADSYLYLNCYTENYTDNSYLNFLVRINPTTMTADKIFNYTPSTCIPTILGSVMVDTSSVYVVGGNDVDTTLISLSTTLAYQTNQTIDITSGIPTDYVGAFSGSIYVCYSNNSLIRFSESSLSPTGEVYMGDTNMVRSATYNGLIFLAGYDAFSSVTTSPNFAIADTFSNNTDSSDYTVGVDGNNLFVTCSPPDSPLILGFTQSNGVLTRRLNSDLEPGTYTGAVPDCIAVSATNIFMQAYDGINWDILEVPIVTTYFFNFSFIDANSQPVSLGTLQTALYNGSQLLNYVPGDATLSAGSYTFDVFYKYLQLYEATLTTASNGNSTIDIALSMSAWSNGYIAWNNTDATATINTDTQTALNFTISGATGANAIAVAVLNSPPDSIRYNDTVWSNYTYSQGQAAVTITTNGTDANFLIIKAQTGGGGWSGGGGGGGNGSNTGGNNNGGGGGFADAVNKFIQTIINAIKEIPPWALWGIVAMLFVVGVAGIFSSGKKGKRTPSRPFIQLKLQGGLIR
jgi:hypothetical protein